MIKWRKKEKTQPTEKPKPKPPRPQKIGPGGIWALCLVGSGCAFALRRMMLSGWEPAFRILTILSLVMLVTMLPLARAMGNRGSVKENFPASEPAALGCALAGAMLLVVFVSTLLGEPDAFDTVGAGLGVAGALCLLLQAWMRKQGKFSSGAGMVTALALAIDLISRFRHWSRDPLLGDYCFKLLAGVCIMLAAYHMAGFPLKLGNRERTIYFTMTGLFFSLLSLADGGLMNGLFYGGIALWLLLGGCTLQKPVHRRAPHREAQEPEVLPGQPEEEPTGEDRP